MPLHTHPIQFCLTEIVALGSLGGFLSVVMTLEEYAFRWNTGQAARYLPGKPPKRLPAVPRAIVAALLVAASSIPKLSPTAASPRPLVAMLAACAASTLAWLSPARR